MTIFLASYLNGVDRKGRVSVPAAFRHEMAGHSRQMVVVHAAPEGGYLYGWAYDDFAKLAETIQRLPALSPTRQRLARTLLAAARPLGFDDTGRLVLPESMLQEAGIGEQALLAGQGEYFTIWNPARFDAQLQQDKTHFAEDEAALRALWGPHGGRDGGI
jgi:MraZ protein